MTTVFPGVHQIEGLKGANAYLLETPQGLVVIDTGIGNGAEALVHCLMDIGKKPSDVAFIALTHSHTDHSQGARAMAELTGAKAVAHRLEVPALEGRRPPTLANPNIAAAGLLNRIVRLSDRFVARFQPIQVGLVVEDGDSLGETGLLAVHAPGHTLGSTCYYEPTRRLLFTGDALEHRGERLTGPIRFFTHDEVEGRRSIGRLADLKPQACFFGHGPPLKREAAKALTELATAG